MPFVSERRRRYRRTPKPPVGDGPKKDGRKSRPSPDSLSYNRSSFRLHRSSLMFPETPASFNCGSRQKPRMAMGSRRWEICFGVSHDCIEQRPAAGRDGLPKALIARAHFHPLKSEPECSVVEMLLPLFEALEACPKWVEPKTLVRRPLGRIVGHTRLATQRIASRMKGVYCLFGER